MKPNESDEIRRHCGKNFHASAGEGVFLIENTRPIGATISLNLMCFNAQEYLPIGQVWLLLSEEKIVKAGIGASIRQWFS